MPKDSPIPLPDESAFLKWAIENPDAARRAIMIINLAYALQVKLIRSGISQLNQQQSILWGDDNAILSLPILWPNGVPAALTTTVADAVATTSATNSSPFGYSTAPQADAIVTNINALRVDLLALTEKVNLILAGETSVQTLPGAAT